MDLVMYSCARAAAEYVCMNCTTHCYLIFHNLFTPHWRL